MPPVWLKVTLVELSVVTVLPLASSIVAVITRVARGEVADRPCDDDLSRGAEDDREGGGGDGGEDGGAGRADGDRADEHTGDRLGRDAWTGLHRPPCRRSSRCRRSQLKVTMVEVSKVTVFGSRPRSSR